MTMIDSMGIVQKTKGRHKTFSDLSDAIFGKVLAERAPAVAELM